MHIFSILMTDKNNKLIIVESPSKARTLKKFLKAGYEIEASVGHIRDLAKNNLGVDIDNQFKTNYIVSEDKKKVVSNLKSKLKSASELYLATDPDREGEAISWHIIEELSPKIPVKRLVFHEITKSAILNAFNNTREIDTSLVNAQEARRIVDRLFGFLISPKLWINVKGSLSAGRVQSPAIKLVVDREKDRARFVPTTYWKIKGEFKANKILFESDLIEYNQKKIATGKDFNKYSGQLKSDSYISLNESFAKDLIKDFIVDNWTVISVEQKPQKSNPLPPFITSTLQQDGVRKLRMSSKRVMIIAQKLYEAGLITYMRTDSTTLSKEAIEASRDCILNLYGTSYLPKKFRTYKNKVKNAQEAHEAIRPTGNTFKLPKDLKNQLSDDEWKLYDLIWKRTIASQMKSAELLKTILKLSNGSSTFESRGQIVQFPGYYKAYTNNSDEKNSTNKDKILPNLKIKDSVNPLSFDEIKSETKATPRFTEASLIKELENLGIGRPSTYASIMDTIQQRGYVRRVKGTMIPTFIAYAVVQFLENYFKDLVNLEFTANLENTLDSISRSEKESIEFLNQFYFGYDGQSGLNNLLDQEFNKETSKTILKFAENSNLKTYIKVGRYGVYIEQGDKKATLHADTIPADLKIEEINEILELKDKNPESMGDIDGEEIYLKVGRFGPYIQAGKKMKSLLPGMKVEDVTNDIASSIISLPTKLGKHPKTGEPVYKDIGRYGPYVKSGKTNGKVPNNYNLLDITLEDAIGFLNSKGKGPIVIKTLGIDENKNNIEIKDGRFGPYITNGKINATIKKGTDLETVSLKDAIEIINEKAKKSPKKRRFKKR